MMSKLYNLHGDTFRSARVLNSGAKERQADTGHIYFSYRGSR